MPAKSSGTRKKTPTSSKSPSRRAGKTTSRVDKTSRSTKKKTGSRKASSSARKVPKTSPKQRPYIVRNSPIHGRGVFAARTIRKGEDIIEYLGRRVTSEEADELPDSDPSNPYHTFLFELNDGRVIDAARGGNASRWINHSCRPNCEPYEDDDCRVFIAAKRTIRAGEVLGYDYKLNVPGRHTQRLLANYACRCGAPRCRGTMVEVKKKKQ